MAFVCKIILNIQQIRSWDAKILCDWSIKNWHQRTSRDPIGCLKYIQHIHTGHLHHFIGLAQFRSGPLWIRCLMSNSIKPCSPIRVGYGSMVLQFSTSVKKDIERRWQYFLTVLMQKLFLLTFEVWIIFILNTYVSHHCRLSEDFRKAVSK